MISRMETIAFLRLAEKSPNVGVTPFLQHMRRMTEFFKTFKDQTRKMAQFSASATTAERLQLVHQALTGSEFETVQTLFADRKLKRDNRERSKQLRDSGNKLYQQKKFTEALKAYTDSALEVTIDENGKSKEIALALGNR